MERTHARELLDSIALETDLSRFGRTEDFSWLPADSVALVYSVGADRLMIWSVTADTVTLLERSISIKTLRELVDVSVQAVQHGLEPDRALSAILLPDRLDLASAANLIVIPDGPLYQLPFGLLRDRRRHGRLVDTTVVTVAPSLSILRVLRARPAWRRPTAALVVGAGQANAKEGLPALPGVFKEIQGLRRLYPAAQVLMGAEASGETVVRHLANADLLHFAGHAVSDAVHPALSRLLLAPGGGMSALRPADIAASRMRAGGLVVLGALDTASVQTFKCEGPLNLARPFLVAGASSSSRPCGRSPIVMRAVS